jgi:hypothetical protein
MMNAQHFKAKVLARCSELGISHWQASRKAGHAKTWLYERFQGKSVEDATITQAAKVLKVPKAYFFDLRVK